MTDVIDVPADIEPAPVESCELCGCAVDLEELIYLRAADLVVQWERADVRDSWRHKGEAPPPDSIRNGPAPEPARQSNRPAQSTIEAFLHLARHDPERLPGWLANHPQDAPELFKIWKAK